MNSTILCLKCHIKESSFKESFYICIILKKNCETPFFFEIDKLKNLNMGLEHSVVVLLIHICSS